MIATCIYILTGTTAIIAAVAACSSRLKPLAKIHFILTAVVFVPLAVAISTPLGTAILGHGVPIEKISEVSDDAFGMDWQEILINICGIVFLAALSIWFLFTVFHVVVVIRQLWHRWRQPKTED